MLNNLMSKVFGHKGAAKEFAHIPHAMPGHCLCADCVAREWSAICQKANAPLFGRK